MPMTEESPPTPMPTPTPRRPGLADNVAGVSIAGLLLPEAVAYSGIAGLPPQAGVIALFAGLLVYGFVGSSRFAIEGDLIKTRWPSVCWNLTNRSSPAC